MLNSAIGAGFRKQIPGRSGALQYFAAMRNSDRHAGADRRLEHDPEKCVAVFRKDHAQSKNLERGGDSTKSHRALALTGVVHVPTDGAAQEGTIKRLKGGSLA